jgi:hypothetical protein
MVAQVLRKGTAPFTLGLVLTSVMLVGIASLALGGISSVGAAVFVLGLALFFVGKAALLWFLRSRVRQDSNLPGFLPDSQWRLLSALYFAAATSLLVSALLGHERFWSMVGLVVSLMLGWTYFVISRKHGVAFYDAPAVKPSDRS